MADLYPNLAFPRIDFSVIGDLPKIAEEAAGQRSMQQSLADLKSMEPDELDRAATRILASNPSAAGLAQAIALQREATSRRELARREKADVIYQQSIGPLKGALDKIYGPQGPGQQPPADTGTLIDATGGAAVPSAPSPFNAPAAPLSTVIGPQSAVEPPILTPSDQVIAAAQQGQLPSVAAGPPTASLEGGPLGVPPPVAPPAAAPPVRMAGGLPWMGGMPNVPPAAPAAPVPPPPSAAAQPSAGQLMQITPEDAAFLKGLSEQAVSLGPRSSQTQREAVMGPLRQILSKYKMPQDMLEWNLEQFSNKITGDPYVSFPEWKRQQKLLPEIAGHANKVGEVYAAEGRAAENAATDLAGLKVIVNSPGFVSGFGSEAVGYLGQGVSTLVSMAKAYGVSDETLGRISSKAGTGKMFERLTDPASLQEAFKSLTNEVVYSRLGSLGKQISDGDRNFVTTLAASLKNTVEGNKLLIDMAEAMNRQKIEVAKRVEQYRIEHPHTATGPMIDRIAREAKESSNLFVVKNPDGTETKTDFALRIEAEAERAKALQKTGASSEAPTGPTAPYGGLAVGPGGPIFGTLYGMGQRAVSEIAKALPPSLNAAPSSTGGTISPQDEGQIFVDAEGRPAGRIRNGIPVPFGR